MLLLLLQLVLLLPLVLLLLRQSIVQRETEREVKMYTWYSPCLCTPVFIFVVFIKLWPGRDDWLPGTSSVLVVPTGDRLKKQTNLS